MMDCHPQIQMSFSGLAHAEDPDFWRGLCPELTISSAAIKNSPSLTVPTDLSDRLDYDGFCLIDAPMDLSLVSKLQRSVELLHKLDYPATFILLFDETWTLARQSWEATAQPNHRFVYDILAWHITDQGFTPHRDRLPSSDSLVTHWIALNDATPATSCLYVIPKPFDPGYTQDHQDPLPLPDKHAYMNIRALPRTTGQSVVFTHRLLHWGSARHRDAPHARTALSFVGAATEPPYLVHTGWDLSHAQRLVLVCAQLIIYYQRFALPKAVLKECFDYCQKHAGELEESYRQKVRFEYCQAMREQEDDDSEVMEEMLKAEEGGYGSFADDYDEQVDEEEGEVDDDDDESSDNDEFAGITPFDAPPVPKKPRTS